MAFIGLTASSNTDGVDAALIGCLTPAAAPTSGDHDEGKQPSVPHLLDSLVVSFSAGGVSIVLALPCRAPAAASTGEDRDEGEVPDVSRLRG